MLGQLTKFEIRYHTRQIGFWIAVVAMFLVGIAIISMPGVTFAAETGERIKANGAIVTAASTSTLSLLAMFFGAVFVVSGVMRDQVSKSLEMIHSTPVTTRDMILSRMIGVYVATFICITALSIGIFLGQFMPWMDKDALGPLNPFYYLQPLLLFTAVNTLFVSGFYTLIAATTSNRALVYVSVVGLFTAYISAGLYVGQDASDLITALSDPFGASALSIAVEFWPADEQNTQMVPWLGYVGLNRLVWGGIGLFLFAASYGLFKRGLITGKSKRHHEDESSSEQIILAATATNMQFSAIIATLWARFKYEYFTTVRSIPFIILTLLALTTFAISIYFQMKFLPNPALATSALMGATVMGNLAIPLLIMVVFFSGEITWRDKTAGIAEILDSSPVKNGPLLAGKWLALMAMVVTLVAAGVLFGALAQVVLGNVPINWLTFLNLAFVSFAPRILLLCVLVLFIQNFMPNRVIGMLASAALVIFFFIAMNFFPFTHPLMEYGSLRSGGWSEMNGFSSLLRYSWFALYWGSLAALFVVLSTWLWRRGTQANLWNRFRSLGKRMSLLSAVLATFFAVSFVGSGALIYKAYNIDNTFRTQKQNDLRQVEWEKVFGENWLKPVPKIQTIEVDVEFHPSKRTATFKGSYIVKNTSDEPLSEVYISKVSDHDEDIKSLKLEGAVRVTTGENIEKIEDFGYRLFKFEPPLAPGAISKLTFETDFHAPRLGDGGVIERNGTFVDSFRALPQFGISDNRMRNKDKRRKNGLPEYKKRPDRTDLAARENNFFGASADYVNFKAKVCTDIGQIPIAPGKMIAKYEENNMACREYQTIRPILNFFAFLSADFEVKRDVWKNPAGRDVPLAIYFHKTHDYNVDLMLDAMKSSLDTFTTLFGPYQYNQIRIMEFPYRSFAQSFAGTIPFSERIGFVMDPGDPEDNQKVDLATYVTMHEIGHQWFAHQIVPANTKGFNVLSEGLTENAALSAYEAKLGWQKARRLLEQRTIQAYLTGRVVDREDEPPLSKAEGQQYLDYNKASWVFWGLKQNMGEAKMQAAIREFLEEYGSKGSPYPTTLQLLEYLRAAAPEDMQLLITDYWDRITFWDLKLGDVSVKPNSDGGYRVKLIAFVDKKIASEETGKETSVTKIDGEDLNEWVEIGFYDKDPKETWGDEWIKLERVRINQLETELNFDLYQRPKYVLLDPRRLLIERKVDDNVKKMKDDKLATATQ